MAPAKPSPKTFGRTLADLGALRLALWLTALVMFLLMPAPGTRAVYGGVDLVTTLLVPVLVPLIIMLLLLDALMSRVFLADAKAATRPRLKRALWVNLAIAALLLLRFVPYVAGLT